MFENKVIPINTTYEQERYGHSISNSYTKLSPGTPFLIVFAIELVCFMLPDNKINQFFYEKFVKAKIKPKYHHIHKSNEYFSTLIPTAKEEFLLKEEFLHDHGLGRLDNSVYEQIESCNLGSKYCLSIPGYDIL